LAFREYTKPHAVLATDKNRPTFLYLIQVGAIQFASGSVGLRVRRLLGGDAERQDCSDGEQEQKLS
jgi:hypothetical protein